MACSTATSESKWLISFISGIVFIVIASPMLFRFTQQLIGKQIGLRFIDTAGVPTTTGLLVHGLVYSLILRLMMIN